MRNMLDIMIENLPVGAEIKNAKERRTKFDFDFCYEGIVFHSNIFKQCAPGYEVRYVKSNIATCMAGVMIKQGKIAEAKKLLSVDNLEYLKEETYE